MMKERIARGFDKSIGSYDKVAGLQRECADKVVSMIRKIEDFTPRSILDVGTGTGYLAKRLRFLYPGSDLIINDMAPKMLEAAMSNIHPSDGVSTILGDMDDESNFGKYDLVASNLALQWSDDLLKTIKNFSKKSKYFAFTCLLDGSFKDWQEKVVKLTCSKSLYDYPTKNELERSLGDFAVIDSEILEFNLEFDSAKEVVRYFKNLGAITNKRFFSIEEMRKIISIESKQSLSYKVFFCVLKGKG